VGGTKENHLKLATIIKLPLNLTCEININNGSTICPMVISVAAPSKAWVCGHSLAWIAISNPAGGMDICLLRVLYMVRKKSPLRADHSPRGVLPRVVSLDEVVEASIMERPWLARSCCIIKEIFFFYIQLQSRNRRSRLLS
jgi:hypothetical protein